MFRFIKEWNDPVLKCERVGHKEGALRLRIRRPSSGGMYVASDFFVDVAKCKRCGRTSEFANERFYEGYTSCSMPGALFEEMREKGFIVISSKRIV